MNIWEMREAKSKFNQLIEAAQKQGPQIVTEQGEKAVVIISFEKYEQIMNRQIDLVTFLRRSPLANLDLDLTRSKNPLRTISD